MTLSNCVSEDGKSKKDLTECVRDSICPNLTTQTGKREFLRAVIGEKWTSVPCSSFEFVQFSSVHIFGAVQFMEWRDTFSKDNNSVGSRVMSVWISQLGQEFEQAELNKLARIQRELESVSLFNSKNQRLKHCRPRLSDEGWKLKPSRSGLAEV